MPRIISTKETEDHNSEEVNEMFDSLTNPHEEEEVEETEIETSQHEENEIEEPETVETTADETEGEQEEEEAESEETKADEKSEDEVAEKLRQRIAELETGQAFKEPESKEEPVQTKKQTEKKVDDVMQFVTDEEFEEIQSDPKKLNSVLARVYQRARQDTMRDIPELIQQSTQRQVTIQEAVKGFYDKSPELRPHAQYVGYVATQVRSENPELKISEVLEKTEERVRENLAISKSAQAQEEHRRKDKKKKEDVPAFAKQGSGNHKGGKVDDRSGFAKQIDQMLETVNR